jgi:hypothetical protein
MWLGACYGFNIYILGFYFFFMKAYPHITRKIVDLVVVATTRVQKLEFKGHELQQLCAYVQHIGVQIAKEDLM